MKFGSLEEMISYIEKAHTNTTPVMGKEMTNIMKNEIQEQVYNQYNPESYERTMQMLDSPQIQIASRDYVQVAFMMMGDWKSHGYGMSNYRGNGSPFFPMYGLESGSTWGRGGTELMEKSCDRIQEEIPHCYKNTMNSLGVPVR